RWNGRLPRNAKYIFLPVWLRPEERTSVATGQDRATPEGVCRSHTLPAVSTWGFVALLPSLEPALEPRRRRKPRFRERAICIAFSFRNSPFHLRRPCWPPCDFRWMLGGRARPSESRDAMPCLDGADAETLRLNVCIARRSKKRPRWSPSPAAP